jgi:outer membrane protein OmpA-like peptidoglycan-associated protein
MERWSNVLVVWIFFCLLTGCGAHRPKRDLIVLLPDPDDQGGAITVTTKGGSQIIDKPGYATEVEDANKPPTAPKSVEEKEIKDVFGPALTAQPDPAGRFVSFILYFEHDTTKLTHESKNLLPEVLKTIKNLKSKEVYVVGHTDLVGTEAYNIELSSRRANHVRNLLVSSGIKSSALFVSYFGKAKPLVPTKDEVPEPRNRRVEVIVR